MALTTHKLSSAEISARNMKRLGDSTTGTSDYIQGLVDELPEYIAAKHNALVDELVTELNGKLTATDTDDITDTADNRFVSDTEKSTWNGKLATNGSANDLTFTDTNSHYTTDEVGEALVQAGAEIDALELLARPNRTRVAPIEYDFMATGQIPGMIATAINSGAYSIWGGYDFPQVGVASLTSSSSANSGYRIVTAPSLLMLGGEYAEMIFTNATSQTTQKTLFGFFDTTAIQTDPTDGIWIEIVGDGTGAIVSGKTASNGAISTTATSSTRLAKRTDLLGIFHRASVELSADKLTATFKLFNSNTGALVWTDTLTTNLPTGAGRATAFGIMAGNTAATTAADILMIDYIMMTINRNLARY